MAVSVPFSGRKPGLAVNVAHALRGFFASVSAAVEAAGAVEAHRVPSRSALVKLGIDPEAFPRNV